MPTIDVYNGNLETALLAYKRMSKAIVDEYMEHVAFHPQNKQSKRRKGKSSKKRG